MVAMRNFLIFRKILPSVVIAALLSLPLVSIIEDSLYTSVEDAIFEVSSLVNEDGNAEDAFLKTEPELSFNADLAPAAELRLHGDRVQSLAKPAMADLCREELIYEIPLPPKIVS
jgi:hypothetical protein